MASDPVVASINKPAQITNIDTGSEQSIQWQVHDISSIINPLKKILTKTREYYVSFLNKLKQDIFGKFLQNTLRFFVTTLDYLLSVFTPEIRHDLFND